jgi:hypothetical protein
MFRFGRLTITAEDLAIWEQFPNAAFTLVRTATAETGEESAAEEFRLGTFELRTNSNYSESEKRPPSGGLFCWAGMGIACVSGAARKFYRSPQSRGLADEAPAGAAQSGVCRRDLGGGPAHSRLDTVNDAATQFDPYHRDGRMLDRSARPRSKFCLRSK